MSSTPTPDFGLTQSTRKPVKLAVDDLWRAINTLELHHAEEAKALPRAEDALASALSDSPPDQSAQLALLATLLRETVDHLRTRRGELIDQLAPIRSVLADLIVEAHETRPENALFVANVGPAPMEEPPWPIDGGTPTAADWYRVLVQNVDWTQRHSYTWTGAAIGPAYLLSKVIEHPTEHAMQLRTAAGEAVVALRKFTSVAWTPLPPLAHQYGARLRPPDALNHATRAASSSRSTSKASIVFA